MTLYRLIAPLYTAPRSPEAPETRREGLFARMFRLWLEHHERVIAFRIHDF